VFFLSISLNVLIALLLNESAKRVFTLLTDGLHIFCGALQIVFSSVF